MPSGSIPKSSLPKHIARLITRWPVDPVRPSSVSVQTYLQSRLDPPPPPPPSSAPQSSSSTSLFSSLFSRGRKSQTAAASNSNGGSQRPVEPPLLSQQNINALYSLLENRYQNQYPLPQSLRYPRGRPEHYDVLLREFEEAPRRSWFGRLGKRLTGALRMK